MSEFLITLRQPRRCECEGHKTGPVRTAREQNPSHRDWPVRQLDRHAPSARGDCLGRVGFRRAGSAGALPGDRLVIAGRGCGLSDSNRRQGRKQGRHASNAANRPRVIIARTVLAVPHVLGAHAAGRHLHVSGSSVCRMCEHARHEGGDQHDDEQTGCFDHAETSNPVVHQSRTTILHDRLGAITLPLLSGGRCDVNPPSWARRA